MPRKKSAAEFFRQGQANGSENYTEAIDGYTFHKTTTNKVAGDYRRTINL